MGQEELVQSARFEKAKKLISLAAESHVFYFFVPVCLAKIIAIAYTY